MTNQGMWEKSDFDSLLMIQHLFPPKPLSIKNKSLLASHARRKNYLRSSFWSLNFFLCEILFCTIFHGFLRFHNKQNVNDKLLSKVIYM